MDMKIVTCDSIRVVGLEIFTTQNTNNREAAGLWKRADSLDLEHRIRHRVNPDVHLGIIADWSTDEPYSFVLAAEVSEFTEVPKECISRTYPGGRYLSLALPGRMPNVDEGSAWPLIFEWLEENGERWSGRFNIRFYNDATQKAEMILPLL